MIHQKKAKKKNLRYDEFFSFENNITVLPPDGLAHIPPPPRSWSADLGR